MSHYFTNDPLLASHRGLITFEILGKEISLYTDNGVFSKRELDEGTRLLLEEVLSHPLKGNILDLGCGIGPIGLTLSLFYKGAHITLSDVNKRALALTQANATRLGVEDKVKIIESDVFSNIDGTFDFIITNPPIRAGKKVTYKIYRESKERLNDNGSLFVVIRKAQGAETASKYIKEVFGNILLLKRHKGYYIYQAQKQKI